MIISPALIGALTDAAAEIIIASLQQRGTAAANAAIAEIATLRISRADAAPARDWGSQPARDAEDGA